MSELRKLKEEILALLDDTITTQFNAMYPHYTVAEIAQEVLLHLPDFRELQHRRVVFESLSVADLRFQMWDDEITTEDYPRLSTATDAQLFEVLTSLKTSAWRDNEGMDYDILGKTLAT